MEITLKPKHEKMINGLVKNGKFRNRSAVVQAAMDVMAEHQKAREDQIELLNREIQKGVDELDRGEGIPLDAGLRQLRARVRERKKQLATRK